MSVRSGGTDVIVKVEWSRVECRVVSVVFSFRVMETGTPQIVEKCNGNGRTLSTVDRR